MADQRVDFLENFQYFLRQVDYCALKFTDFEFSQLKLESDLDLLIQRSDLNLILQFLGKTKTVSRHTVYNYSFMSVVSLYFVDGSYLSIDLIWDFKRCAKRFMDAKIVLEFSRENNFGVRVPMCLHDFEYALKFYALNEATIPMKYYDFYKEVGPKCWQEFNIKYNDTFKDVASMKNFAKATAYHLQSTPLLRVNYVLDTIKKYFCRRGFIVSFTGVDGVGKSSVIEEVKARLEKVHRREVVLLRHRPRILPILSSIKHGGSTKAENIAGLTRPRQGSNKNLVSSILRFMYYYLDYLLGGVYLRYKYIYRGKIVLFDRYFFDFIVDPKRSNINFGQGRAKELYRFIIEPKINFFLWADAEEILTRKDELCKDDILYLTKGYMSLFQYYKKERRKSRYIIIENVDMSDTISAVINEIAKSV